MMLELKCIRAIGQLSPLGASGVQIPGTVAKRKLRTITCVSEPTIVAMSWTLNKSRGGIFTDQISDVCGIDAENLLYDPIFMSAANLMPCIPPI